MAEGKIIGIDLGTTNSCVSVMEGGQPVVITNEEGGRTTPSVVGFTDEGERLVGAVAKRQAVTNPKRTVYSIKRFMGRRVAEVPEEIRIVPYKIAEGKEGTAAIEIDGRKFTPPEISAMILQKLKKAAEDYLGQPVSAAVITVPAYFNDAQRQATKDAGKIAGLDVKRIINEPTAAALAYGLDKKKDEKIAVYDFGGGTFDISILEVGENVVEVKSTNGDTHLGGDNFDQRVIEFLVSEFKKDQGIDLTKDPMAMQRLREAAEKAKIELSTSQSTDVNLPYITADQSGPKHMNIKLSRAKFEQLIEDLVEKSVGPCRQALADAGLSPSQIDEIVLVGGSTRVPLVRRRVQEVFGKPAHSQLNPDEVVALGAAVQAQILAGGITSMLLLDVTPLSLGLETLGGIVSVLISRNTTVPTSAREMFTTSVDGQTVVDMHVVQGERELVKDCRSLARFELRGLDPMPAGMPKIEVTFLIDASGILQVTARELRTGRAASIEVKPTYGLSEADVERMVEESYQYAEADVGARLLIEARNEADTVMTHVRRALKQAGELASTEERARIAAALAALVQARGTTDRQRIQEKTAELNRATEPLAQALMDAALRSALATERATEITESP
jgi:molecular chaperone DnaK